MRSTYKSNVAMIRSSMLMSMRIVMIDAVVLRPGKFLVKSWLSPFIAISACGLFVAMFVANVE